MTLTSSPASERFAAEAPDGRIVFRRDSEQFDLHSVNADGTGEVPLASSTDEEQFSGMTAGGRVIFVRRAGDNSDLYAINADGTGLVQLAASADTERFEGAAGDRVIFQRFAADKVLAGLFSINADGTGLVTFSNSLEGESFEGITSNGRVIFSRTEGGQADLYSINADGTNQIRLTDTPDIEEVGGIF